MGSTRTGDRGAWALTSAGSLSGHLRFPCRCYSGRTMTRCKFKYRLQRPLCRMLLASGGALGYHRGRPTGIIRCYPDGPLRGREEGLVFDHHTSAAP